MWERMAQSNGRSLLATTQECDVHHPQARLLSAL